MSKTYRIELLSYTAKGKRNHIDDVFITSDANKDEVQKHYSAKYKPLSASVYELETVEVNLEEKPESIEIEKLRSGDYSSDPEYRISRKALPDEVKKHLDHLDELDKDVSDTKGKINKAMWIYFHNGGSMTTYSEDSITCRGYIKPLVVSLNDEVKGD